MNVAIIGAGGLGREIKYLIDDINKVSSSKLNLLGYYDDFVPKGKVVINDLPCLGTINDLTNQKNNLGIVFGLGDPIIKNKILNEISSNLTLSFPNLIHPNAKLEDDLELGIGNIITYGCFVSCSVHIGDFNFFNTYCAVGHDTIIGNKNVFMPRVQISGDVVIGNSNYWGMGSSIVQGREVGDDNKINGYTFMTKSISSKRVYFGVPGKKIN